MTTNANTTEDDPMTDGRVPTIGDPPESSLEQWAESQNDLQDRAASMVDRKTSFVLLHPFLFDPRSLHLPHEATSPKSCNESITIASTSADLKPFGLSGSRPKSTWKSRKCSSTGCLCERSRSPACKRKRRNGNGRVRNASISWSDDSAGSPSCLAHPDWWSDFSAPQGASN
ncbi:MAG: hypothetical protein QOJ59_5054 [Thermomicrobiales bacterium]|nr:hypothetical protein [Thermomicrobiales bacterium]